MASHHVHGKNPCKHLSEINRLTHMPCKVKTQYVYIKLRTNYFLYLGKFLTKLAEDQCSSITIKAVSTISNICLYNVSGLWPEIACSMKVSILCLIFAHTAFLFCMAEMCLCVCKAIDSQTALGSIWCVCVNDPILFLSNLTYKVNVLWKHNISSA